MGSPFCRKRSLLKHAVLQVLGDVMTWEAAGAIGEILSALAVLATLMYLALQVRQLKQQAESTAYEHIIEALNDFVGHIAASESLADIVSRGRESYESLNDAEQIRFGSIHMHLLNNLESWYLQLTQLEGVMGDEGFANLKASILLFCDHPGFREFWPGVKPIFPHLVKLMDDVLGDT